MIKKKWIAISFISVLLLISLISFVTTDEPPPEEDPPGFWNGAKLPIGMEENQYDYDSSTGILTDSNGLTFKRLDNGGVKINDERFLAFAITGKINGSNYKKSILDFDWTWYLNETDDGHVFYAKNYIENNNTAFRWTQYYYFYEDPWRQMKIQHYVENNMADITETKMYYLTNVLEGDTIEYNGTKYLVNDYMGLHKQGDLNDIMARVNFNSGYDFVFDDLIDDGFNITDFYIGSGAPVGKPNMNVTAIGFTKGNGIFPNGTSAWVDPTFTTEQVESISVTPLDDDELIIAWCDETGDDIEFRHYNISGSPINDQVTVDSSVGSCYHGQVSVSAFNSTHFVIGWSDDTDEDTSFKTYLYNGTNLTGEVDADDNIGGNANSASVSAFNSTHFVIGWYDDADEDISFRTYLYNGTALTEIIDAYLPTSSSWFTSVSAFNSTHFVIGWFDNPADDASFKTYLYNGTNLTGTIDADTDVGDSQVAVVSAFNSTHFVIGWYDQIDQDTSFKTYLYNGTNLTGIIDADTDVGATTYGATSVSAMNSSYFAISWCDTDGNTSFSVYDSGGNLKAGPIESSSTALFYQTVSSYQTATNIGFKDSSSNPLFIHAYTVNTSQADWRVYNADGTLYDITSPTWSNNITNDTFIKLNDTVVFNVTWADGFGLSGWIFNSNITGTEVNQTFNTTWGPNDESTYYMKVNVSGGKDVFYRFYANDTLNNWGETDMFNFTVQIDTMGPTWSNNITNDTYIQFNETIEFNVTWADETGLSGWIFNSNITGTEVNQSFNTTWGGGDESSYTINVNVSEGQEFFYRFYANDTLNYWNETDKFVFTVRIPNELLIDLEAYYTYDTADTGGGIATDVHDDQDGTITNAATGASGKINEAIAFDGTLDYVTVGTGLGNNLSTGNMTFQMWINLDETVSDQGYMFIGPWAGVDNGHLFVKYSSGGLHTRFNGTVQMPITFSDTTNWHHYVFVWNGTEATIYLDGKVNTSQSYPGGVSQSVNWTGDYLITGCYYSTSYCADVNLDEIAVWSRELTSSEVSQLYSNGRGNPYDFENPTWSNNITNDTYIQFNDTVVFNVTWQSIWVLDGWIFNSNITGTEINSTFNTTWGPINESSYTIKVNVSRGKDFFYRFYANDTINNWGETDMFVITASNTAPTQSIPIINSTDTLNRTNGTLGCFNQSSADLEGDTVTNSYKWFKNGTVVAGETATTLASTFFNKSDILSCEIAITDGTDTGIPSNSTNLTISNTAPVIPNIISPANNTFWNIPLNLQYNTTDIDSDALTYYIYINETLNGSTTINWSFNATTGFYNWSVVAGDGSINTSNSSTWNFTIDTTNPNLNITSPINRTIYSLKTIALTIASTDTNLDYCFFNVTKTASGDSEGSSNRSADCSDTTSLLVDLWADYTVHVYSFDLAGNSNSSSIKFTTAKAESGAVGGGGAGPSVTITPQVIFNQTTFDILGAGVCGNTLCEPEFGEADLKWDGIECPADCTWDDVTEKWGEDPAFQITAGLITLIAIFLIYTRRQKEKKKK